MSSTVVGFGQQTGELSDPLTPSDCDLRRFPFIPLYIDRLRRSKSWLRCRRQPAIGFYMMNLWIASWHEVPAASLEADDDVLADAAMCHPEAWDAVKADVLVGWVRCKDGRLYHPVVAEMAKDAFGLRQESRKHGQAGATAKWGDPVLARAAKVKRHERLAAARQLGTHADSEWNALVAFCGGACVRCGTDKVKLVKDHIQPIYLDGSDSIENLQPMCGSCNSSKGSDDTDYRRDGWKAAVVAGVSAGIKTPAPLEWRRHEVPSPAKTPSNLDTGNRKEDKGKDTHRPSPVPAKEAGLGTDMDPGFCRFWEAYPKKDGKGAARAAWAKARGLAGEETIIIGVVNYAFDPRVKYQPLPATWLNQERWLAHTESDSFDPVLRAAGLTPADMEPFGTSLAVIP